MKVRSGVMLYKVKMMVVMTMIMRSGIIIQIKTPEARASAIPNRLWFMILKQKITQLTVFGVNKIRTILKLYYVNFW